MGVYCVNLCSAVLVELRLVTDRQTDGQTHRPVQTTSYTTRNIALCDKNRVSADLRSTAVHLISWLSLSV